MNKLNQKLEEKIKLFDEIDKNISNYSKDSNLEKTDYLSNMKKTEGKKNENKTVFNKRNSDFDLGGNNSIYYTSNYCSMANYLKGLDQKINVNTNYTSKNNTSYNLYNSSNKKMNNYNKSKVVKKSNKKHKNISVPKFSHQLKNIIENDPEKFVETLFYNKKDKQKEKEIKKSHLNEGCKRRQKENIYYNNFTYRPKISKKSKEIASKLEPTSFRLFKKNKIIDKEELEKITIESYKNLFKNKPYKFKQKNTKENGNNAKVDKLIKKLYDGGINDLKKKELIYQENIIKKSEEYKNYPYQPNKDKKNKSNNNNNSINNGHPMSLEKFNNDMYLKQIEWKNKKNEYNKKRKEFEEELFLSKNCTFKPDINQPYIKDDEKTIQRNLSDINNYIIKRRKQISNKKEKENKMNLRNYNIIYKQKNNNNLTSFNLKLNSSKYFVRNNKSYINYPRTDRTYYNYEGREFNSSFSSNTKIANCSQNYFVEAVNALHNEILNLNI